MRIVLPFSFIYFYTVKNGRFLSHFLSVISEKCRVKNQRMSSTVFCNGKNFTVFYKNVIS